MSNNDAGIGLYNVKTGQVVMKPASSLNAPSGGVHLDLLAEVLGEGPAEAIAASGNQSDWRGFVVGRNPTSNQFVIQNISSLNLPNNAMALRFLNVLTKNVLPMLNH